MAEVNVTLIFAFDTPLTKPLPLNPVATGDGLAPYVVVTAVAVIVNAFLVTVKVPPT